MEACSAASGAGEPKLHPFLKMIELTRTHEAHSEWNVKVLGVGGAGTHAADRLTRDGLAAVEILAANTDARALSGAATSARIVLGQGLTRGLGAGGDPELGRAAAMESLAAVGERLAGASLVILLAGLGGGTGSGATPSIAQLARAQGSHVAVFATLPFTFEGRRRREQALEALDALREHADFVVCFENDRMPSVADPASGIEDAFESVDSLLAQAVRAITEMTRRRNVLHSGIDEIASTVAEPRSTALFGYGVAEGEERARAAVARAFDNPLLDTDGALGLVSRLWVYVAGGPDMRWSEVQTLMSEISERVSPEVRLFFGAAVDPSMAGAISVTLLAGIPGTVGGGSSQVFTSSASAPAARPSPMSAPAAAQAFQAYQAAPEREEKPAVIKAVEPGNAISESPAPASWHESSTPWQDIPPSAPEPFASPVASIVHDVAPEAVPHLEDEPVLLPLEVPAEPAPAHVWSTPTPPFEVSKERRREAAAHEAALHEAAQHEAAQHVSAQVVGGVSFSEPPVEDTPVLSQAAEVFDNPSVSYATHAEAAEDQTHPADFTPVPEMEVEPVLPLGMPRENGKRTKDGVQEQMRFEAPNRGGRFEKTDPTIVDGEDLDVPTFMRQRLPIE